MWTSLLILFQEFVFLSTPIRELNLVAYSSWGIGAQLHSHSGNWIHNLFSSRNSFCDSRPLGELDFIFDFDFRLRFNFYPWLWFWFLISIQSLFLSLILISDFNSISIRDFDFDFWFWFNPYSWFWFWFLFSIQFVVVGINPALPIPLGESELSSIPIPRIGFFNPCLLSFVIASDLFLLCWTLNWSITLDSVFWDSGLNWFRHSFAVFVAVDKDLINTSLEFDSPLCKLVVHSSPQRESAYWNWRKNGKTYQYWGRNSICWWSALRNQ